MRRPLLLLVPWMALLAVACGPPPAVVGEGLALRRVVVYRNGVGYFLRGGHVSEDRVHFKVRGNEIGDFLASLAVIEHGGSSVKSASFPLRVERDSASEPPVKDKRKPNDLETVVMDLDGRSHDLEVGYIAATPVWRPSYRLVVDKDGVDLQVWGIVQNLSGEDWKTVGLSLVTGAPLSFEAALGTPVIPVRPRITDQGDVIAAVPQSETSLDQEPPAPPASAPAMDKAEVAADEMSDGDLEEGASSGYGRGAGGLRAERKEKAKKMARPSAPPAMSAMARSMEPMRRPASPSRPRNLSALAAVAVEGSATRYDIPTPVTVPDKSATMVMLLAKRVPGEAIFLYAPDGGVGESQSHPFRVARFTNKSGGLLEKGPLAIFEEGSFLGQGMLEPLPDGAVTTVPFALERGIAVSRESTYDELGARLFRIDNAQISIERDAVTKSKYKVRNGNEKLAKVLVKHARSSGTRLHEPPKGTEDNVGTGSALVPIAVPSRATAELVVDERQAHSRTVDWLSQLADDAVRGYINDRRADPTTVAQLQTAWDIRRSLVKAIEERRRLTDEQSELSRATEETRNNLKALEKNKTAGDLRDKLSARLAKHSLRLDEITRRLVELDMQINEQRVRFTETVRGVRLLEPLPPA